MNPNTMYFLCSYREDVIREVVNAPKRRIDNELNRLTSAVQLLKVYCDLVKDVTSIYYKSVWNARILVSSVVSIVSATGGLIINQYPKNNNSTPTSIMNIEPNRYDEKYFFFILCYLLIFKVEFF